MNIGKQIHVLLKKNTSVYVKGLGVFKRVHTPASFDAHKNVYLPPVTFIELDTEATDGYDLITYIQQTEGCERTEAEQKVADAVSHIQGQVLTQGQVMLDNLGQLIGYGNSYVFKPLDLSGFGFAAVEAPPVAQTSIADSNQDPKEEAVTEEPPVENQKEEEIVETSVEEDAAETAFEEEEEV